MHETLTNDVLGRMRCPRDGSALRYEGSHLACGAATATQSSQAFRSCSCGNGPRPSASPARPPMPPYHPEQAPLYLETVGLTDRERESIRRSWDPQARVDSVISHLQGATSGDGYLDLVGKLDHYPIPSIPLSAGEGRLLVDVGASWGRWSVSAARKGWKVIAIDPSLGALLASRRAFREEGLDITLICGDARHLPLASQSVQAVFSYSVIQHFSTEDADSAIGEMGRVLDVGGLAKVQMACRGIRWRLSKPGGGDGIFRVRYRSIDEIREMFTRRVGPVEVRAEAFGGLGLLPEDFWVVSAPAKAAIVVSQLLRAASRAVPRVMRLADSVYASARREF